MSTPTLDLYKGKYYAFWSDGRRSKRKSMGTADLAVAERRFAHWLLLGGHLGGHLDQISEEGPVALTVRELWPVYFEKHLQKAVSASAVAGFWPHLDAHFGPVAPADITQELVDRYEKKRKSGTLGRSSSSGTIRKELAMLMSCLNWHASRTRGKNRLLSPGDLPAINLPADSLPRDRWLSTDEIKALLAAAKASAPCGERMPRVERFIWIALETAARKHAILELTWDRVDLETGMIHFAVPGQRQTKKRRASVPISTTLRAVLLRMKKEAVGPLVLDNKADIWLSVQKCVVAAGIAPPPAPGSGATGVSPHTLRHTAATHMARRGVPLFDIAGVLGNSLAVVERTYAKHCPGRLLGSV